MIVRDEEKFLGDCLQSISPHVDEIVVFDTGSKDSSVAIARDFGAVVHERAWVYDFAAARNWALDAAKGGWILYIDADERLSVPAGADLRTLLDAPGTIAFTVLFHPRPLFTAYREIRLFRNDPRLRFKGVIHESIHPSIRQVMRTDDMIVDECPLVIVHHGYEGDLSPKHHRNLPLLVKAAVENPKRVYLWQQLSEVYSALGDGDKAREAFDRAMAVARCETSDSQRADAALCAHSFATFLAEAGEDPLPTVDEGLAIYPGHRALMLLRAKALVAAGAFEPALPLLDALIGEQPSQFHDPLVAYDRRIFTEFPLQLKGLALLRLGRTSAAAEAFEQAAAAAPGDRGHSTRAVAIRALANRSAAATA